MNRREIGPRSSIADVAAKEDCLLSVEEETMFRPVGEVGGRVQDEEPDHQRKEEQGMKDQPADGQSHLFWETFFPALVWALH